MRKDRLPHDPAYKQFFSHAAMVESLLRDFVPEDFVGDLDFSTLERCSGSYVTDDLRERHEDIIWRLRWRDSWCYLYLLLEFQSTPDPWMAVRILCYTALLYQDLIKTGVLSPGDPLPPVFPMVIYNGGQPWNAPRDVAEMLAASSARLAAYQPRQRYFLLDEGRVPEDILSESDGLAAILLRLERATSPEALHPLVGELRRTLEGPRYAHLRRVFAVWLGRVVFKRAGITRSVPNFEDLQEVDDMLEETAARWREEWKREGLLEGMAEGRALGKVEALRLALKSILVSRFKVPAPAWEARLSAIQNADLLQYWMEAALTVDSLETFEALCAVAPRERG